MLQLHHITNVVLTICHFVVIVDAVRLSAVGLVTTCQLDSGLCKYLLFGVVKI